MKKILIPAVLCLILIITYSVWLTAYQNRVIFPDKLESWYNGNADELSRKEWLTAHGFETSAILGSYANATAYRREMSTTGGYSTVTIFDIEKNGDVSFQADSYSSGDEFTYSYTIRVGGKDHVWIQIYANSKASANTAVEDIFALL